MSSATELQDKVRARLQENPSAMTMMLAKELEVPEVDILRAFPEDRVTELDLSRWEDILRKLEAFGKVHVIVSNGAATIEAIGTFGGFSTWGQFFNVQSKSLDMHIRYENLSAIFAVEKPSHMSGINTLSLQFYDTNGHSAFKVFFTFGNSEPKAEVVAQFDELRTSFRK